MNLSFSFFFYLFYFFSASSNISLSNADYTETLFRTNDVDQDGTLRKKEFLDLLSNLYRYTLNDSRRSSVYERLSMFSDKAKGIQQHDLKAHFRSALEDLKTPEDVCKWFSYGLQIPQYCTSIHEAKFTGEDVIHLLDDQNEAKNILDELGIQKLLDQKRIIKASVEIFFGLKEKPKVIRITRLEHSLDVFSITVSREAKMIVVYAVENDVTNVDLPTTIKLEDSMLKHDNVYEVNVTVVSIPVIVVEVWNEVGCSRNKSGIISSNDVVTDVFWSFSVISYIKEALLAGLYVWNLAIEPILHIGSSLLVSFGVVMISIRRGLPMTSLKTKLMDSNFHICLSVIDGLEVLWEKIRKRLKKSRHNINASKNEDEKHNIEVIQRQIIEPRSMSRKSGKSRGFNYSLSTKSSYWKRNRKLSSNSTMSGSLSRLKPSKSSDNVVMMSEALPTSPDRKKRVRRLWNKIRVTVLKRKKSRNALNETDRRNKEPTSSGIRNFNKRLVSAFNPKVPLIGSETKTCYICGQRKLIFRHLCGVCKRTVCNKHTAYRNHSSFYDCDVFSKCLCTRCLLNSTPGSSPR